MKRLKELAIAFHDMKKILNQYHRYIRTVNEYLQRDYLDSYKVFLFDLQQSMRYYENALKQTEVIALETEEEIHKIQARVIEVCERSPVLWGLLYSIGYTIAALWVIFIGQHFGI